MPRNKEESLKIPMEGTLYDFIGSKQTKLQKDLGRHVSKAEAARRMLNVFMYLEMSPDANLGAIVQHASEFEDFLIEESEGQS